jgi:hypothetical protein
MTSVGGKLSPVHRPGENPYVMLLLISEGTIIHSYTHFNSYLEVSKNAYEVFRI